MIRDILFLPPAATDVEEAVHWYNRQAQGLGRAFLADLHYQLLRIRQFPDSYPALNPTCRRSHLQRFPHTIVYRLRASHIEVVAVVHHRSDPASTRERAAAL